MGGEVAEKWRNYIWIKGYKKDVPPFQVCLKILLTHFSAFKCLSSKTGFVLACMSQTTYQRPVSPF